MQLLAEALNKLILKLSKIKMTNLFTIIYGTEKSDTVIYRQIYKTIYISSKFLTFTVSGFEKSRPFRLRNGVRELIASGSSSPVTVLARESSEFLLADFNVVNYL